MPDAFRNNLPKRFVENVIEVCGARGEKWLENIPEILMQLSEMWEISVEAHFLDLSCNYAAPARMADGSAAVIKLALPSEDLEIFSQAAYLLLLDGNGAVRLIAEDRPTRAILIERALPGYDLKVLFAGDQVQAVEVAIPALKRIVRDPPDSGNLIKFADWYEKLRHIPSNAFPRQMANEAFCIFDESRLRRQLIHGDFHHTNILADGPDSFTVIDPKGVIGDIRYDIAVFLNNHQHWLRSGDKRREMQNAVLRFAEAFDLDPRSLERWAFAQLVLSSFWTFSEAGSGWRERLGTADIWNV